MLSTARPPLATIPPMADRAVQAYDVAFQQGGYHQCLTVGIPGYPQGVLLQLLWPVSVGIKVVPIRLVWAMKLGLGSFSASVPGSLLWLGRTLPMPDALPQ